MEYERIHTHKPPQVGIISPSKLRMKLTGQKKKDAARTSPCKLQHDTEFVNNCLLASDSNQEQASSMGISSLTFDNKQVKDHSKEDRVKAHQFQKPDSISSSSVHPVRSLEDDNLDYDSNASSSSFEFHKHERSTHNAISRSLLRPMSSKWNDAEKWIINKQNVHNHSSKNVTQNRGIVISSVKWVDFSQSQSQPALQSGQTNETSGSTEQCPEVRSVSMRDMGTEMTPIPSQEPSMTSTPVGATTPLRSPNSSIPSSPKIGGPTVNENSQSPKKLTEEEVKLRTRKEILQLGMQLGKTNIAAWASKEDMEKVSGFGNDKREEDALRIEYEKRATAWEDAEKSKHNAKFMREEIKIQAWESQQKAKLEAEMKRIEAEVEQKRANAQAKMLKKIALAKQKSEAKRAAAETAKNRHAARAAEQAEYIRQTGRIPPSSPNSCCGWS
ncbi:uncharacterized protein LOC143561417 [Bidens hawaiensis]|uniref:uncharacterized protein LOC143561417 n=1 Tax=Bidens hawaiensis TaxID=980011 RepID=UPI00404ABDA8